jgi:hypothetical protein
MLILGAVAPDLRVIGHQLDLAQALRIELAAEQFIHLTWYGTAGRQVQTLSRPELQVLELDGVERRQLPVPPLNTGYEEQLRVLGQQVDTRRMDVHLIAQEAGGFWVRGSIKGHYTGLWFPGSELLHDGRVFQQRRLTPPPDLPPDPPAQVPWWRRFLGN